MAQKTKIEWTDVARHHREQAEAEPLAALCDAVAEGFDGLIDPAAPEVAR